MNDHAIATAAASSASQSQLDRLDVSTSERLPVVLQMVRDLSRADRPEDVLKVFGKGWRALNGPLGYVSVSVRGLDAGEYRITRKLLEDDFNFERDDVNKPWDEPETIPVHHGGLIGEIIQRGEPVIIHNLQLDHDIALGDEANIYHSVMAVPLYDRGEALNWAVSFSKDPTAFEQHDLEDSLLRGNLVGGTVKTSLLMKQLREAQAQIRHEIENIAGIQRALLPGGMPKIAGVSLGASYETYDQAGGDYYDFIPLQGCTDDMRCSDRCAHKSPEGEWGIFIADAAGHGPAAAVMMAMLHSLLHSFPRMPDDPGDVLAHINGHLERKQLEGRFATAWFGIYEPASGRLRYAMAGHPPPLVKDVGSGNAVHRLDEVGSLPLGITGEVEYETAETVLQPNQSLVLYTDGITEAMNPQGKMFQVEGIERALVECTGEPECVVGSVTSALREHEAGRRPTDDQTIVVLKRD